MLELLFKKCEIASSSRSIQERGEKNYREISLTTLLLPCVFEV